MPPEELVDVVDAEDQSIDQAPRSEVHAQGLLHRAVHAFLIDPRGRVLLQRRSEGKAIYPGLWTSSASGHVDAGEDPDSAVEREIAEELGAQARGLELVGRTRFDDDAVGEHEITYVYTGALEGELDPDPAELDEIRWLDPTVLDDRLATEPGPFAPSMGAAWRLARREIL